MSPVDKCEQGSQCKCFELCGRAQQEDDEGLMCHAWPVSGVAYVARQAGARCTRRARSSTRRTSRSTCGATSLSWRACRPRCTTAPRASSGTGSPARSLHGACGAAAPCSACLMSCILSCCRRTTKPSTRSPGTLPLLRTARGSYHVWPESSG